MFALTTKDNKFNPISDYENWRKEDVRLGYFTNEYLGRIAKTSSASSEADYDLAVLTAMYEIVEMNPNLYEIVFEEEKSKETNRLN